MRVPRIKKRRPLDDHIPDGYQESNKDFVKNNFAACVWFLENRDRIAEMTRRTRI